MPRGGRGSHSTSVPIPLTQSALDARELCGKGYSRMNEFEAHESSYDHQHKKRFMEMKQMQKGASSIEARRERERRAEEKAGLITIKPIKLGSPSNSNSEGDNSTVGRRGFKSAFGNTDLKIDTPLTKPKIGLGFKKAFAGEQAEGFVSSGGSETNIKDLGNEGFLESDTDGEEYERYNPAQPTT